MYRIWFRAFDPIIGREAFKYQYAANIKSALDIAKCVRKIFSGEVQVCNKRGQKVATLKDRFEVVKRQTFTKTKHKA